MIVWNFDDLFVNASNIWALMLVFGFSDDCCNIMIDINYSASVNSAVAIKIFLVSRLYQIIIYIKYIKKTDNDFYLLRGVYEIQDLSRKNKIYLY